MTRILLVHNDYRSAEPSGENEVVRNEATALSNRGHDVRVWGPSSDEIASFNGLRKLMLPGSVVWSRRSAAGFSDALDEHRPDVVHLHNTFPLISGSVLRVLEARRLATVATLHNYRILCAGGSLHRNGRVCHDCLPSSHMPSIRHGCYRTSRLATAPVAIANAVHRHAWENVDVLLTLSEAERRLFIGAGFSPERLVVKPNFVPDVRETEVRNSRDGDGFVYAGRLTDTKGIGVVMDTWRRLASVGLHPRLTIAGSGPLEEDVRRFGRVHPSVEVVGPVNRSECYRLIAGCRAVLSPSTWEETFGLVVVEAMMLGRPAIASAIGSFPDMIHDDHDGTLVVPGDASSLMGAVENLDRDPGRARRLGANARTTYEGSYAEGPNIDLLESLYEHALNRSDA
jgi:glycosyltransferase involved in cell wall biosynthesis